MYVDDQLSLMQIAEKLGWTYPTTRRRLIRHGVKLRTRKDGIHLRRDDMAAMKRGRRWKMSPEAKARVKAARQKYAEDNARGWRISSNGYVEYTTGEHAGRSVHVITMERRLGRRLRPDEVVHHIDGDPQNNNQNNLALMTRAGHTRLHRREDTLSGNERDRLPNGQFAPKEETSE